MSNRKGVELSINFLVIMIISLIVFGFGIYFINRLSSQATDIADITFGELDQRIGELICEGSAKVCIGIERQVIRKGKLGVFGLKILNIEDTQQFEVTVLPSNPMGYDSKNKPIQGTGSFTGLLVTPPTYATGRAVSIERNEEESIGIGVQVPKDAPPGTYIFNVDIKDVAGTVYSKTQKIYVDVQ